MKNTDLKFGHFVPIREADGQAVDELARTARVVIITEGLGNLRDRNYYAKSAVESCSGVFNGKQFYVDHPSKIDEENRPERSVRDLAGYFFDCQVGQTQDVETGETLAACYASLKFAESEPGRLAFEQVKSAIEYQKRFNGEKDVFCGISINGGGVSHPDNIGGMPVNMVTEIKEAFSADIVTKPARGGKFLAFSEAQRLSEFKKQVALGVRPEDAYNKLRGSGEPVVQGESEMSQKTREAVADEAKKAMLTGEGQKGMSAKIQRLVAAINEPPEDPKDLIADIQGDLDALGGLLDDLKAVQKQAETNRKAAEKEAKMAKQEEKSKAAEDEAMRKRAAEAGKKTGEAEAKKADEAEGKKADEAEAKKADEAEGKKADEDEAKKADEAEGKKADEAEAKKAGESEDEAKKADEDETYGMRADEDDDEDMSGLDALLQDHMDKDAGKDDDAAKASERMKYNCETCSAENEVIPPQGFRLVRMDEQYATESQKGLAAMIARLRRALEAKEARFMEANKDKRNLMQEVIKLRARVTAFERAVEARKMLREAGIPKDILSPMDLLAFEPHQWATQIKAAKRVLESESKLINKGGNGAKDGGARNPNNERGADAAIASFRESYTR